MAAKGFSARSDTDTIVGRASAQCALTVNHLPAGVAMPMRDKIIIKSLLLRCIIGVNDWERENKQDVMIDLVIFTNLEDTGRTDDPADILNYRTLTKRIIQHVEESQYRLVEALATSIARICCVEFKAPRAIVRVEKPGALRFARSVGVEIEREPADFI
jgi:FolB domain-containing protein